MIRRLQLILMLLCLGIFIFPKQAFDMPMSSSCCEAKTNTNSCCSKENKTTKPCHKEPAKKKNCNKERCSVCKVCHSSSITSVVLNQNNSLFYFNFNERQPHFGYHIQPIVDGSFNIWQPPKIA